MTGVAVVGAAETTQLGKIPDLSQIQLQADAALNAMADAGLRPGTLTVSPLLAVGRQIWRTTWVLRPLGWMVLRWADALSCCMCAMR